jgi:hypothetical protein
MRYLILITLVLPSFITSAQHTQFDLTISDTVFNWGATALEFENGRHLLFSDYTSHLNESRAYKAGQFGLINESIIFPFAITVDAILTKDNKIVTAGFAPHTFQVKMHDTTGNQLWEYYNYETLSNFTGIRLKPSYDSTFLLLAVHEVATTPSYFFMRFSYSGDTLLKIYGTNSIKTDLIYSQDSNFILLGYTDKFRTNSDISLLKQKPNGDTIWSKTYSIPNKSIIGNAIVEIESGNIIIVLQNER